MSAKDVIIALDFPTREETLSFLDQFPAGEKPFVKIGMELFYAEGPQVVRDIKARGHKIFLDLKLHDIPNTVKRAMAVLSRLDVDMVNLHAAGTSEMMRAALEGLTRPDGTRPLLIAVTQLTSTDQEAMERDLMIHAPIDEVVMHYAETYFLLSALSYPFIGLYNAGAALFRAQGNSKISMLSSLVMNVVNIGGNAVLIYGFGMGVMGAALASLVSRAIACAVVLYLLQKPGCALRVDSLRAMAPNGGLIRRILRVGIPAGIENGMFQIGKLSVSSLTSTLGTAAIAANAVANTTTTFLNIPANAVGMAALTVVGQCLGAGEKEQAVYYSRRLMLTAYCGAWVMNLSAFFFANRFAVSLFNLSPEAQAMALDIMVWFNIVSLFVWPSSFTLPNILRAAGDARFTMTVSIVSMWAFRVGFCYLVVLCFGGGLLSIWMGMYLDWVFRSLCFYLRFRRGSWLEQSVI